MSSVQDAEGMRSELEERTVSAVRTANKMEVQMQMRRALSTAIAMIAVSCGGGSPSAPSSPTIAQVAGVWAYRNTLTTVSGGECVGAALQGAIGITSTGTLQITQSGASLNATSTDDTDGSNCTYTGTAGSSSIALNGTGCSVGAITDIVCQNGARRDIRIQTSGVNATISGNNASGSMAETWNVFVAGTAAGVGPLTLNGSFTATRR